LVEHPELKLIRIEGHTDSVGRKSKNLELSKRRARSVGRYLVEQGIDAARLAAFGCGQNVPIASNDDDEGRQKNRRVEFHILDPKPPQPRDVTGCSPMRLR